MLNIKKICLIVLTAAFVCTFLPLVHQVQAVEFQDTGDCNPACPLNWKCVFGKCQMPNIDTSSGVAAPDSKGNCPEGYEKTLTGGCISSKCKGCDLTTNNCTSQGQCVPKSGGGNAPLSPSTVTGCSSNYGLFSGLITTGKKVFNGLRDLIYVVAGFGIIGVAVGGFFGNLNWKWLGAIIIALVVIASTGEIINMITGCDNFTTNMITDTLK